MPNATASRKPERRDLETCPGGYVELRRLTYGETLHRRDLAMRMTPGEGRKEKSTIDFTNERVQAYEFEKAIIDHNLEDESGAKLNFSNRADIAKLDSKIAQEIEKYIQELNDPDADGPSKSGSDGMGTASEESNTLRSIAPS